MSFPERRRFLEFPYKNEEQGDVLEAEKLLLGPDDTKKWRAKHGRKHQKLNCIGKTASWYWFSNGLGRSKEIKECKANDVFSSSQSPLLLFFFSYPAKSQRRRSYPFQFAFLPLPRPTQTRINSRLMAFPFKLFLYLWRARKVVLLRAIFLHFFSSSARALTGCFLNLLVPSLTTPSIVKQ